MLAEQRQSMADQAPRSHHRTHKKRLPEGNDTSLVFANLTRLVRLLHSKFYNKDFLGLVSRLKQKWSKLRRLYIPNKTLLRAVSLKTPLFQTVFMSLKNKFMSSFYHLADVCYLKVLSWIGHTCPMFNSVT